VSHPLPNPHRGPTVAVKKSEPPDPPCLALYVQDDSAIESAKRRLTRIIDGELDELSVTDALDLLSWLEADVTVRRIETEGA
jgi:hypothetical protein